MLGRTYTGNPNAETASRWEGKTVSFNGSGLSGTVLQAFWQGPGKAVQLRVRLDGAVSGSEPVLTDSEHVVITRV